MVAIKEATLKKEDAELLRLEREELRLAQGMEQYETTHLWEFFKPYRWQALLSDLVRSNLIVLATAPNGIGKSVMAVCILASWVMGYEAWNKVKADYPNAIKVEGVYYKPSSLGTMPPVDIRVTGDDWDHSLNRVVVKAMKTWFPVDAFHIKKNPVGVEYFWTHKKNGSTIELMTHGMEPKLFEGWRGHGWIPDEPPPYSIFKPMARGLAEKHGKILIPTTPLREAWMLDKLVLSNRSDVAVMKDLTLYDNEGSYDTDNKILDGLGLGGKRTKYWRESDGQKKHFFDLILDVDDFGVAAEKYLRENAEPFEFADDIDREVNNLIFLRKAKDTALDEKASRFRGIFQKLVGLVIKEFDKSIHILPADLKEGSLLPEIPTNWTVSFQVDFHLGTPQAIAFYAWDERNVQIVIDEVWENMSAEEIASLIIRRKKVNGWNIEYGEIDPLSKGDDKYMKNRDADAVDSYTIMEELLEVEGIELGVANKDKKSGIAKIKALLKRPKTIPGLYFLDSLQSVKDNAYGIVYEIQRLSYVKNPKTGHMEVEKIKDHFVECLYRSMLMGMEYRKKEEESFAVASASDWNA